MYYRSVFIVSSLVLALVCSTLLETRVATSAFASETSQTGRDVDTRFGLATLNNGRLAYRQLIQVKRSIENENAANARFYLREADDFLIALTQGRDAGPVMSLTSIAEQRVLQKGKLSNDIIKTLKDEGNDVLKHNTVELRLRADRALDLAQSKAQKNDPQGAIEALDSFHDIIAFRIGGKTLDMVMQDINSAEQALRPDNTGPTLWQGATVAVNSALNRLAWINTRAGSQLLKARDLVHSALVAQSGDVNVARLKIEQADKRFKLIPSFDKLSGLASHILEAPKLERPAISQLLGQIDAKIAQFAAEGHSRT